jgi:cell division protein FtsL
MISQDQLYILVTSAYFIIFIMLVFFIRKRDEQIYDSQRKLFDMRILILTQRSTIEDQENKIEQLKKEKL